MRWWAEAVSLYARYPAGIFVTVAPLPDEGLVRDVARELKNRIALWQKRANMRRVHWAQVFEARPSIHPHIVAPFPSQEDAARVVASLNCAPAFLKYGPEAVFAEQVDESKGGWGGLATYVLKETTPQAWFAAGRSFPRAAGSHALGAGGGDRVIVSRDTEETLLRAGKVEPRTRTYASRSLKRPTKARRARGVIPGESQLSLFPNLEKPIARLHDFVEGIAPPTVAQEIEFLRRRKGLTQAELARRSGMSRQRLTNFVRGRFGTTAWAVQRIREALA